MIEQQGKYLGGARPWALTLPIFSKSLKRSYPTIETIYSEILTAF